MKKDELDRLVAREQRRFRLKKQEKAVHQTQKKRSLKARIADASKTAKRTIKPDISDPKLVRKLDSWLKQPGRYDISGIDTKGTIIMKHKKGKRK